MLLSNDYSQQSAKKADIPQKYSIITGNPPQTAEFCCAAKQVLVRSRACFGAQQSRLWCAAEQALVRTKSENGAHHPSISSYTMKRR